MSTHNICFRWEIRKIYLPDTHSYLDLYPHKREYIHNICTVTYIFCGEVRKTSGLFGWKKKKCLIWNYDEWDDIFFTKLLFNSSTLHSCFLSIKIVLISFLFFHRNMSPSQNTSVKALYINLMHSCIQEIKLCRKLYQKLHTFDLNVTGRGRVATV